jgi:putative DNA primase/helicase
MDINQKGLGNDLKSAALEYAYNRIAVFPLKPLDKTPIYKGGFHNATADPQSVAWLWDDNPQANIGMPTGTASGRFVLDIDNKNGSNGFDTLASWEKQGWILPKTLTALTPNAGKHHYFNYPGITITSRAGIAPGIDIRGDGGYVVVPPSRLDHGEPYRYEDPSVPIADAPQWLLSLLTVKSPPIITDFQTDTDVIANGRRNDTLIRKAGALRRIGADEEQIFRWLWDTNLSRCNPPLDEKEVRGIATSAGRWQPAALEFPYTDSGNAELFAHLNNGQLLYDHRLERWLVWQQHWWAEDNTGEVTRRAKQAARERQRQAATLPDDQKRKAAYKFGIKSENRSRIEATINLAKSELEISDSGENWDTNSYLLGVANGVVDLKTGQLRNGQPSDRISLHANVAFDSHAVCPRWEQFMQEIFQGQGELISYVQRAIGYSLTGATTEHVMFIAYGTGANGKSVMLRVLTDLWGGYGKVTPVSTLDTGYNKSAISNDVAALANRRLIWASETEQTSMLNEAKVKQLVHGDEVTARHLYQEFFTFTPIGKIWLTVNDLPTVRDSSHGMWRSIHVIPFRAQFDGEKADPQLTETLKAEMPGILNWAVKGCLEWQQKGLKPPTLVSDAASDYRQENDALADFIASYCEQGEDKSEVATALYKNYTQWAGNSGIKERDLLGSKTFYRLLKAKFPKKRINKGTTYFGLQLIARDME